MQEEPEFDDPITIDKHRLDEEWERQPTLVRRWYEKLADARLAWADAKAALDVVKAETAHRIREDPDQFGLSKTTVDAIKDAITTHPKVINAVNKLNLLAHKVDMIEAVCKALEHKKKGLESEVTLFLNNYFAEPRQPKDPGTKVKFNQMQGDAEVERSKAKKGAKK